jgi:predicted secreted protein
MEFMRNAGYQCTQRRQLFTLHPLMLHGLQLLQCGIRSMELSASGMFSDAASLSDMTADVVAGNIPTFKVVSGRGDVFIGAFLVASCERNGEYNAAEQYSLSLASAGSVAYTPAP